MPRVSDTAPPDPRHDGFVRVRGAREHNLRGVDVDIPRDVLAVFTGVSGSGKSSLAFGTIYAEAQRRYFESVAPYARRLIHQIGAPKVGEITGLPPAVSLQQQPVGADLPFVGGHGDHAVELAADAVLARGQLSARAPSGSTRTRSRRTRRRAPARSATAWAGCTAPPRNSLVPDPSLSIREGAIAAWPGAWQGKNLRDILDALGYDVDRPWRELAAGGPRLDPVHGRAAGRHRAPGAGRGPHPTPLPGHVHERASATY